MSESLADFFDVDDFAIVATVNGSRTVNGLLDLDIGQALGLGVVGIGWTCQVADAIAQGDSLVIDGVTYRAAEQLAGDGAVVTWRLHRVS